MDTRLAMPRFIERPQLLARMQRALQTGHLFLLAPAGYGKSACLRALVAVRPTAHLCLLTPADNDRQLLQQRLQPALQNGRLILLDDIHHLEADGPAADWLAEQLAQFRLRWLLAGRQMPLPVDHLLISGQAMQLGQLDLRFDPGESELLLGTDMPPVADWLQRLQGWPLGVSLLSRMPSEKRQLPATREHLFDYLAAAVFGQLSPKLRRFLQLTAIPLQFNAELATYLWDGAEAATDMLAGVQAGNLFLQPAAQPGWHTYHDLVQDYLRQGLGDEAEAVASRTVDWLLAQGDEIAAVEQALSAGLTSRAAVLLSRLTLANIHRQTRYRSYRRWIWSLDKSALLAEPMLLIRLANVSLLLGQDDDAAASLARATALSEGQPEQGPYLLARAVQALLHYRRGDLLRAQDELTLSLSRPDCQAYPRLFTYRIASLVLSDAGHLAQASACFAAAGELANTLGMVNEQWMNRANRALHWQLRRGDLAGAGRQLAAALDHFKAHPGWQAQYLTFLAELNHLTGDWDGLAATLERLTAVLARVESVSWYTRLWQHHYQAVLAIAVGTAEESRRDLEAYATLAEPYPAGRLNLSRLRAWRQRRRGDMAEATTLARQGLAKAEAVPYYRVLLAWEHDLNVGMVYLKGDGASFALQQETVNIVRWRLRPQLFLLRALLTAICWHDGDPRWRRHWRAAAACLDRPGYAEMLQQAEPEIGCYFWLTALVAGVDEVRARAALQHLGRADLLLAFYVRQEQRLTAESRLRLLVLLGDMGDERGLPVLTAAVARLKGQARQAGQYALQQLERASPPPLTIRLMGSFALWRGDQPIVTGDWHRPVTLRLFQYFAIQAGQPLTRDQILEDLWPDREPDKAWATFRSVYSHLRRTLEPYMRPKGPNRYFAVRQERYTFDPDGEASIDLRRFEQTVLAALADPAPAQVVSAPLLAALEDYAPLLPELPYAHWLVIPRQRANDLFVDGGLLLARQFLAQADYERVIAWTGRIRAEAPWLEAAYQIQMRAQARAGRHSAALLTFQQLAAALRQELDVTPDALSQSLEARLRRHEPI